MKLDEILAMVSVNDVWKGRNKSSLIKWLVNNSTTDLNRLAQYLGITKAYLNNKLNRNSFSIDDFIISAYACNYTVLLIDNCDETVVKISPDGYFSENVKVLTRIQKLKESDMNGTELYEKAKKRYEEAEAEFIAVKEKYNIKD